MQFFTTTRLQIWSIFDPSPPRNANVLNGCFLTYLVLHHQDMVYNHEKRGESKHFQSFLLHPFLFQVYLWLYQSLKKLKIKMFLQYFLIFFRFCFSTFLWKKINSFNQFVASNPQNIWPILFNQIFCYDFLMILWNALKVPSRFRKGWVISI